MYTDKCLEFHTITFAFTKMVLYLIQMKKSRNISIKKGSSIGTQSQRFCWKKRCLFRLEFTGFGRGFTHHLTTLLYLDLVTRFVFSFFVTHLRKIWRLNQGFQIYSPEIINIDDRPYCLSLIVASDGMLSIEPSFSSLPQKRGKFEPISVPYLSIKSYYEQMFPFINRSTGYNSLLRAHLYDNDPEDHEVTSVNVFLCRTQLRSQKSQRGTVVPSRLAASGCKLSETETMYISLPRTKNSRVWTAKWHLSTELSEIQLMISKI